MITRLARLAVLAVAAAASFWLLPATVAITVWPAAGPARIAFLPPLARLWLALAVAALMVAAAAVAWQRSGRALDDFVRVTAPLSLLLLWIVPFAPFVADRAPALLVFAGPFRWAVLAAAGIGVVVEGMRGWHMDAVHVKRGALLIAAFAVYAAMGVRFTQQVGYGGDEPHYLVITHSLLADHDLDIANNHERQDYAPFYPGILRPDFLKRGLHEEIYSIHAPGLPAMLVPAYAVGGAVGTVIFMAALAALASLAIFDLARMLTGQTGPALVTWAAVCFSVPFVPHAWLIYPEIPGALIVAWAVLWLWQPPTSVARTAAHGVALAVLPWLHTKFAVFLALLTAFELLRLWPRMKHMAALLAPIAVSGVLWLLSFYWMYGVFDPEAPYGTYTQMFVVARNIPRGTLGLLFDQKFGLLVYSPLYVLVLAGAWLLLRDTGHRARAAGVLFTAVVFFVSTTRLYMWWGGSSAPARFLVPIVPLLAPAVATAIARLDDRIGRALVVSTVLATLGVTVLTLGSTAEGLLYSYPHGVASLVTALQGPAPLDLLLPTFTEENWRAPIATLLPWFGGLVVSAAAVIVLVRAGIIRASFWVAGVAATIFFTVAGLAGSRPTTAVRTAAAARGQLALLQAYDPSRFHAIDATRGVRLTDAAVRTMTTIEARGPMELPEGKYQALVWFEGTLARAGDALAVASEDAVVARAAGPIENPARITFELPVPAPIEIRLTDQASSDAVRRVDISAVSLVPRSQRVADRSVAVESIDRGLIAYTDHSAYPEHGSYWTRGTERTTVVVAKERSARLRLVLHVGPTGGQVEIDVDGKRMSLDFQPDETRDVPVELSAGASTATIGVRAARAFVPAEIDRANQDHRSLGCQVRPVLF